MIVGAVSHCTDIKCDVGHVTYYLNKVYKEDDDGTRDGIAQLAAQKK